MKKLGIAVMSVMVLACLAIVARAQGHDRGTSELALKGKTFQLTMDSPR